jgi:hypothetical protein
MTIDSITSRRRDFDKDQELMRASRGTKKRGELAELAFVYKAAGLGFAVARPYGDSDRYDFIVHSGEHFWRVQVKSSSAMQYGAYLVNAQRNSNGRAIPYSAAEIDFLVAHIVPEDTWFVIPVRAFTPRKSVRVYPKGDARSGRYEKYREAWCLMG